MVTDARDPFAACNAARFTTDAREAPLKPSVSPASKFQSISLSISLLERGLVRFLFFQCSRVWDDNLPIETTRSNKRLVEHVNSVRRGNAHDLCVAVETIQLYEQLIQRLVTFIVTRATATSRSARRHRASSMKMIDGDCFFAC